MAESALAEWRKLVAEGEWLRGVDPARRTPAPRGRAALLLLAGFGGWGALTIAAAATWGTVGSAVALLAAVPPGIFLAGRHDRRIAAFAQAPPFPVTWGPDASPQARAIVAFVIQLDAPSGLYRDGGSGEVAREVASVLATMRDARHAWPTRERLVVELPASVGRDAVGRELLYYFVRLLHAAHPVRAVSIAVAAPTIPRD